MASAHSDVTPPRALARPPRAVRLPTRAFRGPSPALADLASPDATGSKNMLQLLDLRWIAVVGQVVTIGFVQLAMGVSLPLWPMLTVVAALILLNVVSLQRLRLRAPVGNAELFLVLALDVAALTGQLYLSGGITNPFIPLYLLQVTLASVLLELWWAWAMVGFTGACFLTLTIVYRPLVLPDELGIDPFKLHLQGLLVCFVLDAVLLVVFVTRITGNLRARDAHLARMRQHAAEEEHVVRMGLLASGAAHELGTPLATVSVILGDWQRMPALHAIPDLAQEIDEMQLAVQRCKSIISGILLSAGETRGEAAGLTTIGAFLADFVREAESMRPGSILAFTDALAEDVPIVVDRALQQVLSNLLDNAYEAPSLRIRLHAARSGDDLLLSVSDDGPGFAPDILARFGNPYCSTKGRLGGGLGLFLVVNVVRKLGGSVTAENGADGGATVTLALPLAAIGVERDSPHAG